jgi:hypothetical protein
VRRALLPYLPSARIAVLLMAAAIAMAVAVVVSVLAVPKPADAATKLVSKSFSNARPINIPAGAPSSTSGAALPYPSFITSSFPSGSTVRDVNVILRSYTHTWPDDVDVLLVHGERNRTILSDAGGDNPVNTITITLDDEAVNGNVGDRGGGDGETQLVGGRFKPFNYEGGDTFNSPAPNPANANSVLAGFDGLNARGGWKLFVQDDGGSDSGAFAEGWTIQIKAAVPQ